MENVGANADFRRGGKKTGIEEIESEQSEHRAREIERVRPRAREREQ